MPCILNRLFFNLFAKPNEQNDACIKSAMARMPKASRTEAALSPKGRGADSGGESEAAKGGCEETNSLTETMQECMQKTF